MLERTRTDCTANSVYLTSSLLMPGSLKDTPEGLHQHSKDTDKPAKVSRLDCRGTLW